MARSVNEIYDQIIEEKEAKARLTGLAPLGDNATDLLDELTSDSKVAIWRLWAYITALIIHTHETLWDVFKSDIERIAEAAPAGTPTWLQKKVKEYQHGDSLEYIGLTYKYPLLDKEKQIVSVAAIEERTNGVVLVKVAKDDGNGGLQALSENEKNGLTSYCHKIKFAGTRLSVFTSAADQLDIRYDLYYDPIVPLDVLIPSLEENLGSHLRNLSFNGSLNVNKFTDALQRIEGVVDPVFREATSTTAISGDSTTFDVEHHPASGYFEFANDFQTMFNFLAKV